jgi:hypothetical protein
MKMAVWFTALIVEAASASQKLINFYQTTWHYNPKDRHLPGRKFKNAMFISQAVYYHIIAY